MRDYSKNIMGLTLSVDFVNSGTQYYVCTFVLSPRSRRFVSLRRAIAKEAIVELCSSTREDARKNPLIVRFLNCCLLNFAIEVRRTCERDGIENASLNPLVTFAGTLALCQFHLIVLCPSCSKAASWRGTKLTVPLACLS